jgi:hypothetical protein
LFSLFATGVIDTGGNLPPVWLTPAANLPPVLTSPAVQVGKFAASFFDIGGKFTTDVVDTNCKFATGIVDAGGAPRLANISVNFSKIRNYPNVISGAWGKTTHEKNLKQKILWHCLLKEVYGFRGLQNKKWNLFKFCG